MNQTLKDHWNHIAEHATTAGATLARDGHRFAYEHTTGNKTISVWAEPNAPHIGCRVTIGEDHVSYRCWNLEAALLIAASLGVLDLAAARPADR